MARVPRPTVAFSCAIVSPTTLALRLALVHKSAVPPTLLTQVGDGVVLSLNLLFHL